MDAVNLTAIDYSVMGIYVLCVVAIGLVLNRYMKSSSAFLTSGNSIPAWITGLAFVSANLGALELVGMGASGAKYGIATAHFYWVGAIPAMIFLAVFMMPFYYGSKARSVPEYLKMRFDERVRCLNSIAFAVMTIFASGISMNALAKLLNHLIGLDYHVGLWVTSAVVLIYVLKGGLTSAIYTEVLQFFMIVLGFAPVVWLGMQDVGGWGAMNQQLSGVATNPMALGLNEKAFEPNAWNSAWQPLLGGSATNPMGVDLFAMVFGLGFVLSFGYWCTNFLVVQRAMAAKDMGAARRTPLIGAIPKMFLPFLVIIPGMLAVSLASIPDKNYQLPPALISESGKGAAVAIITSEIKGVEVSAEQLKKLSAAAGKELREDRVKALLAKHAAKPLDDQALRAGVQAAVKENDYDGVILSLVQRYCPTGLLGLALTALLASFMSGMAGNVTAFNTVWTYDLYQAYIAKKRDDAHYLFVAKATTVVGIILSIGAAYFASMYNNAMDIIQLVFGFVNAPLFATFLLGMFWTRTTGTGAFLGLLGGIGTSALFHALTTTTGNVDAAMHAVNGMKGGYISVVHAFPSDMAQNFWLASFAFIACFVLTGGISLATARTKTDEELKGLVYSLTPRIVDQNEAWYMKPAVQGLVLLAVCIILNIIFW